MTTISATRCDFCKAVNVPSEDVPSEALEKKTIHIVEMHIRREATQRTYNDLDFCSETCIINFIQKKLRT